jgi:hypothetical protein
MNGYVYEPQLDRFDVAVRAAAKLALGGREKARNMVGLGQQHHEPVKTALLEIDNWRSEAGVFELIERCPFLLDAALELLRMYDAEYADTRTYHYRRRR